MQEGTVANQSPSARLLDEVGLGRTRRRSAIRLYWEIPAAAVVATTGLDKDSVVNPASALCASHPHAHTPARTQPDVAYPSRRAP
jgi:hypothetical protein